jgi:valyl-tRNA synthetase
MTEEFPKNYNFTDSEKKWQDWWAKKGVYKWDSKGSRGDSFIVDTPPPTVSGQLHIGHVYSYTNTDFIVRFQRMMGKNIFYPMGFDDNGLPTERLVEKQKQVRAVNMDRQEFINICNEVVATEEQKFRALFNSIALSVDWDLEYQTISPRSRAISQMSFLDLVQKGQVYRNDQPMLWDPVDQTALAQADIEDKEKQSVMNEIVFEVEDGQKLAIATTRPEMLPACVALFYHPDDQRYQHLKGKHALSPIFATKVPILADDLVQQDKGTGLVMCCTFGDVTDILWWKKHRLETKIILSKRGTIDIAPEMDKLQMNSLKVNEARNKILEALKEQGLLLRQTEITHTVKCAERSGAPLEILTTPQWFVKTIEHKEALLAKTAQLKWRPESMKIKLENWINSIAWDWCISRQRYFGVPFPVWYSKRPGEEGKPIFASPAQLPVDPIKDLPEGYGAHELEPDLDVMDTWATSSVSPQLNSWGISENLALDFNRHGQLFPATLRPQAHEIIRTWAFYTMLKAHLHQDCLPWENIMISGWCLAEDRSKMSKSKGNVIVPEKLLEQYGADVVRYWAANAKLGADTAYSEDVMKNGKRLVNKLWNAAKFVSQHFSKLSEQDKTTSLNRLEHKIICGADKWLILKLKTIITKIENAIESYEYADAMHYLERFFWDDFCDNYLEITKARAYNKSGEDTPGQASALLTLYHSFKVILQLFAPFIPYITEEIYQIVFSSEISVHTKGSWPKMGAFEFGQSQNDTENMIRILNLVRKAKAERNLSIKAPINLIEVNSQSISLDLIEDLKKVTSTSEISFVSSFKEPGQMMQEDNLSINIIYQEAQ